MQNFNFGKYKGQFIYTIIQQDIDYCIWIINNVNWKVFSEKQLTLIEKTYYKKYGFYPLKLISTAYNIKYNGIYLKNMSNHDLYKLYNQCSDFQWAIKVIHKDRCLNRLTFVNLFFKQMTFNNLKLCQKFI